MAVKTVEGIDNVINRYKTVMIAITNQVEEGLETSAADILEEARDLCPQDTGNLKESSYYVTANSSSPTTPSFNNKRNDVAQLSSMYSKTKNENYAFVRSALFPTAVVSFSAPYANIIHEINKNYNVGQWKYLETALKNNTANIVRKMSAKLKEVL